MLHSEPTLHSTKDPLEAPSGRRLVPAALTNAGGLLFALALSSLLACAPQPEEAPAADDPDASASIEQFAEEAEQKVATATDEIGQEIEALRIKASILDELGLAATGVEIEIQGRTAVLTGEVEAETTGDMAEEIARAADSVDDVDNRIAIVPQDQDPGAANTPVADRVAEAELEVKDAVLESRVKASILSELGRTAFDIEVEASRGTVSLRGDVADESRRQIALDAARGTTGVEEVIDLLAIGAS